MKVHFSFMQIIDNPHVQPIQVGMPISLTHAIAPSYVCVPNSPSFASSGSTLLDVDFDLVIKSYDSPSLRNVSYPNFIWGQLFVNMRIFASNVELLKANCRTIRKIS